MTRLRSLGALAAVAVLVLLGLQPTAAAVKSGMPSASGEAAKLLARARQARGSAAAWGRLRNLVLEHSHKYVASAEPPSPGTYIFAPPDAFRWVNGDFIHTIDRAGYRQNHDVPPAILESAKARVFRTFGYLEIIYLLQWPSSLPVRLQPLPGREFQGKKVDVLRFAAGNDFRLDLLIDSGRGLPIGYIGQSDISGQTTEAAAALMEYRDVEGVAFPFRTEGRMGDYKFVNVLTRVRINVPSPFTEPSRP